VEISIAPASTETPLRKCTEPGDGVGPSKLAPVIEEEEFPQRPGKAHIEASKDVVAEIPTKEDESNANRNEASIFENLSDICVTSEELFQDIAPVSRPASVVETSSAPLSTPSTDVLVSVSRTITTIPTQSGS